MNLEVHKAYELPSSLKLYKRCFDVIMSIISIILFFPIGIIIGFLIKKEDGGDVFFVQERIGKGGKPFILYKFRSMKLFSEKEGCPLLAKKGDKRLSHIGKFLREHHLDELPQLWNVLKGDMSFVGYRPERRFFIDKIMAVNSDYELLYNFRPGLFSNATLYNGYTDTMEKMLIRLEMDLDYLDKCSFWVDVQIIFKTTVSIFIGKKI